jgi:hypothetical protein
MIALSLYLASLIVPAPSRCEEHGPRLDGTYVTVCKGSVVRVRDGLGNSREWDRANNTVTIRSNGAVTMVVR